MDIVTQERAKETYPSGVSIFGHPAIDCDVHPAVPSVKTLMPYFDEYWREQFTARGIDRLNFIMTSQPPNAPITSRPDWRLPAGAKPGSDPAILGKLKEALK